MGRSGTSALARVLSLCGASLPEPLLGANESNPRGYWEPLDALRLNDDFLFRHGATWFDPTLVLQNEIVFDHREREAYIEEIRRFLDRACPNRPLLVIKEPRITAVAEFWFEGARRAGLATKIVIPVRHPEEVAASLASCGKASLALSAALWLKYNLLAELRSRGLPRAFIEYPNLLNDWRREIARISSTLSVNLSNADEPQIDAFLRHALHRQRRSESSRKLFNEPWIERVYSIFSAAARGEPCDPRIMDEIFSAYSACERMFRISVEEFHSRFSPQVLKYERP
ncbi:MAG: sulfotransferase family protein [Bryobacteraceae bacterium]